LSLPTKVVANGTCQHKQSPNVRQKWVGKYDKTHKTTNDIDYTHS